MSGRIRTIKPELLEDAVTAGVSHAAFRLYVGAIVLSDDYGNFRAEPRKLLGEVFWARTEVTAGVVTSLLVELAEAGRTATQTGLFGLYRVRGQLYGHIRNWEKHQKVDKVGNPRVPSPNDKEAESCSPTSLFSRDPRESLGPDLDHDPDQRPRSTTVGFGNPTDAPDVSVRTNQGDALPDASNPNPPTEPSSPEAPKPTAGQLPLTPSEPEPALATGNAVQRVHEHYVAAWKRHIGGVRPPKLDEKRRTRIRDRLRERFTVEDLCRACDGIFLSRFHMGDNDRNKRFIDLELVCRDAKHVEEFMSLVEVSPAMDVPPAVESNVEPIALTPEQRASAAERLKKLFGPVVDEAIQAIGGSR